MIFQLKNIPAGSVIITSTPQELAAFVATKLADDGRIYLFDSKVENSERPEDRISLWLDLSDVSDVSKWVGDKYMAECLHASSDAATQSKAVDNWLRTFGVRAWSAVDAAALMDAQLNRSQRSFAEKVTARVRCSLRTTDVVRKFSGKGKIKDGGFHTWSPSAWELSDAGVKVSVRVPIEKGTQPTNWKES